jgi:hypothetical protein
MFGAIGTMGTPSIIPKSTIRVETQADDRGIAVNTAQLPELLTKLKNAEEREGERLPCLRHRKPLCKREPRGQSAFGFLWASSRALA